MTDSIVARVGPATGIIGVVLTLVGYSVHGYPAVDATEAELVRWARSTEATAFSVGIYVEGAGIILVLAFFTWICTLSWRDDVRPWFAAAAFAGFVLWTGSSTLENATFSALLYAGRHGVAGQDLAGLHAMALNVGTPAGIAMALAMICTGLAGMEAKTLPTWLTWPAIAIGLGWAVPNQTVIGIAGFALFVWIFVVAIRALISPTAAIRRVPAG